VDAGKRMNRDVGESQALRDAADRAAVLGGVEAVGRLDHRELGLGQAAQERLARDRRVGGGAHTEKRAEREAASLAIRRDRRRRRRPFLQPAVIEGVVLAELADVDEAFVSVGRVTRRPLTHQEGALTDGAAAVGADSGYPHPASVAVGKALLLGRYGLLLLLRSLDQFLRDVRRHFLVPEKFHVI